MSLLRGLIVLAAILAGIAIFARRHIPHGKLGFGIWYWHSPFAISDTDRELLRSAGIDTVYVRAATFTTDGKHVLLRLPQTWKTGANGLKVVEVFNFDPGLLTHFSELPVDTMASDVATRIVRTLEESRSQGIDPSGIQLDIDCPTRLLPKYADFLHRVRAGVRGSFKHPWTFSITALPTWLTSSKFDAVARETDFVVPQFYESRIGKTLSKIKPISDPEGLSAGLSRLDRKGIRYYAGLPAYGHAMLFDKLGRLSAMYQGLSSEDALRHPLLAFQNATPLNSEGEPASESNYAGEDLLTVKAVKPDSLGRGEGDTIAFLLPASAMVKRGLEIVDRESGSRCLGAILYRFPEPGETSALSLQSLVAAMNSRPETFDFDVKLHSQSVPYALIGETKETTVPREFSFTLEDTGNVGTRSSPDAVEVLTVFDRPGIGAIALGDFDRVEVGTLESGSFVPCGRARATAVLLKRSNAQPGQKLRSGAIELDGPASAQVSWTAQGMGGFRSYHGSAPTRKLAELSK